LTYGDELYLKLLSLNIQPPKLLPSKPRVTAVKRGTQTIKGETTEMMKNTKFMKRTKTMALKKAGQHVFEVNSQGVGGSLDPIYSTFSTFASGNHSQAHPHMSVWAPEVQPLTSNEDRDVHSKGVPEKKKVPGVDFFFSSLRREPTIPHNQAHVHI